GPALGGHLSDMSSWRWAFFLLVPVGLVSSVGLRLSMLPDPPLGRARLDWIGFLSLAAAISCVQLVLSRGQRLDWYESPEIVLETIGAGLALYVILAHSLTAERPFLTPPLLLDRTYPLGLPVVCCFGTRSGPPLV